MVPYVSYSQGFKREDLKTQFSGIYNPRMAQIGYQDVPAKVLLGVTPESFIGFGSDYVPNDKLLDFTPQFQELFFNPYVLTPISPDDGIYDFGLKRTYLSQAYNPNEIVGRQVAWAEYMSDVDESRGLFALDESLENWVLNRSYKRFTERYKLSDADGGYYVSERVAEPYYSTYLSPGDYNELFVDTEPTAQNFRQFIKFDVFVKRAIPSRTLPHL